MAALLSPNPEPPASASVRWRKKPPGCLSYHEQDGGCLMAHANGEPTGFIAWRALPSAVALDA